MSAVELLRKVKSLSAREREKFVLAVLNLDEMKHASRHPRAKRLKWPDVEARARRIFGRRTLPNLVLLEREDESC
jgi:hypothetical protein